MKTVRPRYSVLMAVGIILLATSRPYEGMLLCLPVAFVLGRWIFFGSNRPTMRVLFRCAATPLILLVAAGAWMGYYDYRAFGNPLTLPYKVDRTTYAVSPYYVWQSLRHEPVYRHKVMRDFYCRYEVYDVGPIQTALRFLATDSDQGRTGRVLFCWNRTAAPADHAAACVSRPSHSVPSYSCACSDGRHGH